MSAAAIKRVNIKDLDLQTNNILLIGIIIGKQRPRILGSFANNVEGQGRAVWNFTLRDSVQYYINIVYWNTEEEIIEKANNLHIGDIVEITRPRISVRNNQDNGEQYRPMVTSPFFITLGDKSEIKLHCNQNIEALLSLLNYPTKPVAGFVPIRDIQNNGSRMKNTVDIFGSIKNICSIRSVKMKSSETVSQVLEFEIFDQSCLNGLKVNTWDPEFIFRSVNWKVRTTILFITDVKIEWSTFHKSYLATTTSRTIITENPICSERTTLMEYAKNAPISSYEIADEFVSAIPNVNSIQDIMSIKQIHDRINSIVESAQTGQKQFTALVFALVTKFDLDGLVPNLRINCSNCNSSIPPGTNLCDNIACASLDKSSAFNISFDMRIDINDHTGGIKNCRLCGKVAETALGCSALEFQRMSNDQKAQLKWRFLLERCTVRLAFSFFDNRIPITSIVDLSLANIYEASQRLPTI